MYDYITGKIDRLQPTSVVIDNNGIGYHINISLQTFSALSGLSDARLYIHQYAIRDELPVMYGFFSTSERDVFRLLIGVSGVGGNTSRVILSTFTATELRSIISSGNSKLLKSAKGLGIKTAEKIIVELRDKMTTLDITELPETSVENSLHINSEVYDEAISALVMLGFNKIASAKVVKNILADSPSVKVEDVIRLSLKKL